MRSMGGAQRCSAVPVLRNSFPIWNRLACVAGRKDYTSTACRMATFLVFLLFCCQTGRIMSTTRPKPCRETLLSLVLLLLLPGFMSGSTPWPDNGTISPI
ncbi:uncharacterized protein BO66DRAFT_174604 [Aspergillus aculeatinus CBS 121060]|uniref:Uncharacterized protein n=1 Tax=Aspergillus aculeatinus CBS 121060 TaxID=1448322 RepID=A0ACD1HJS2_9EURO|nr:hypothetical protein BO66DRAFT_174604 [Aspergillus aculeatinus CBS 121060]RAH73859.1 hypothetical protein BO66DRAFT_174604 [Aspergillus aculeatinus CBS 121060]